MTSRCYITQIIDLRLRTKGHDRDKDRDSENEGLTTAEEEKRDETNISRTC